MSGLLGSWATENHSRLLKQLNTRQKNLTTSSSWKQENISLGVEKQWPSPLILTDMDEYECVPLCESIWHMHTICAVFARYAQAHVTGSGFVADACACWCVIVAKVLCMKPALFIEITAPCAAYCVCEGCKAGFFLLTYTRTTVGFFIRCLVLLIGQPRSLSLEVNIQHDWLGFLKTHRQDGIYCYDMTCSGIGHIRGIQPLIFTNNAVWCSWVILCPNSQTL